MDKLIVNLYIALFGATFAMAIMLFAKGNGILGFITSMISLSFMILAWRMPPSQLDLQWDDSSEQAQAGHSDQLGQIENYNR